MKEVIQIASTSNIPKYSDITYFNSKNKSKITIIYEETEKAIIFSRNICLNCELYSLSILGKSNTNDSKNLVGIVPFPSVFSFMIRRTMFEVIFVPRKFPTVGSRNAILIVYPNIRRKYWI